MPLPIRSILTVILTCALCIAAPVALAQNGPGDDPGPGNGNGSQGNQTGQGQQNQSQQGPQDDGDGRADDDRGPPTGTPGAGDDADRRGADPVEIRDTARGFRTEPPAGSARPEIDIDAMRAVANLQRAGVHPLQVQLDSLVEFQDEDEDGAYDLGEEILQRVPLRNRSFEVEPDHENMTRDIVYTIGDDGRFILRFHLGTDHDAGVGAKFDVIIEGFPYQANGTMLALGMRVDTPAGLQASQVNGENALIGDDGDEVPYLSWESEVIADGAVHNVGSSVHLSTGTGSSDEAIVYWAYPQAAMILHDPVLGVTEAIDDLIGDAVPFIAGLAAAAAVLAVGYTARRRRPL